MAINSKPKDETIAGSAAAFERIATWGAKPTVVDTARGHAAAPVRDAAVSFPGFRIAGLIGQGGMGEVVRGHDIEIGRDVAIKRLRSAQASPELITRFLREAKIQARLEHPAIIPVHSIGRDSDNLPYFTMKRITGVTLGDLIDRGDQPRQRLLRAFVDVCRAIDFAHGKRVVHRDLKPSNVMLGDYGEVYVLDWGLARVLDAPPEQERASTVGAGIGNSDGSTQAGSMFGTPGYMAPEQIEDAHTVGPAADVYALGSILFEILAGEYLHEQGEMLASTLDGTDTSPSDRRPERDIPPELDTLCIAALARDPNKRPSARELADRIEGFLDGDRDIATRRRIVALELSEARAALASGEAARRSEAMQAAGRALALDPESRQAADLITTLMLEPPNEQPAALREQLLATEVALQRRQGRVALASFAVLLGFLVISSWNGVRDWMTLAALVGFTSLLATFAFIASRRAMSSREILLVTCGNAVLVALMSRMFGSLLIAPAVTCVMALSLTAYPQNLDRARVVIAILVTSWLVPVILEWTHVIDQTWWVADDTIVSSSSMFRIGGGATVMLLVFANVLTIYVFGRFANTLATARRDAQRQVQIQAWHLQQLLPERS
ncbi:MAG TPA: serine/threonine-protein kinase [Kofleriaceae bacterium]